MQTGPLAHVRWLGGGSGAGKSTVSRALARRYGVDVYDTDAAMADHVSRLSAAQAPALQRFLAMSMDQRWVLREPAEMLETFHWFAGEGFELVVADLLTRPTDRLVVAEGIRLLPHLVLPLVPPVLGSSGDHAVWLLPTPAFRRHAFAVRGSEGVLVGRTSDPPRALANLLARDALFTERLAAQLTARAPAAAVTVDGSRPLGELVDEVAGRFGLRPPSGSGTGRPRR